MGKKLKELADVEFKQRKGVIFCCQRYELFCRHNSKHIDNGQLVFISWTADQKVRGSIPTWAKAK
jgi:hypothetical protein